MNEMIRIRNTVMNNHQQLKEQIDDLHNEITKATSLSYDIDSASMTAWNNRYIRDDGSVGTSTGNTGVRFKAVPGASYTVQLPRPNEVSFGIGVFGNTDVAINFKKDKMADKLTVNGSPDASYVFVYWRGDDQPTITCLRSVGDEIISLKEQVEQILETIVTLLPQG